MYVLDLYKYKPFFSLTKCYAVWYFRDPPPIGTTINVLVLSLINICQQYIHTNEFSLYNTLYDCEMFYPKRVIRLSTDHLNVYKYESTFHEVSKYVIG